MKNAGNCTNKYLVIKFGGSTVMEQMLIKTLNPFVHEDSAYESPSSVCQPGSMVMLVFHSDHSVEDINQALRSIQLNNYVITVVDENTVRAKFANSIEEPLGLNSTNTQTGRRSAVYGDKLESMSESQLKSLLQNALETEDYVKAAQIRDILSKKLSN